jgi:hypothetical protein
MIGFLKLCTISFTIVVLFSFCGCVIFNWLALSPKANQAYRDRCEDAVFRCAFACQYALVIAAGFAVLWLTAECFNVLGSL